MGESDEGVFIARINPGGHASRRSEELEVGQRIIEVNGQSLLGATHSEATDALRNSGNTIHLLVCDAWNESAAPPALKGLEENLTTLPCSEPAVQNGNRTSSSQEEDNNDQQPPRPNSAQEIMDAVHAADAVLRPKSPGAESTKSTDSFREQRLTTIKMAASHPSGSLGSAASAASAAPPPPPPQTSTKPHVAPKPTNVPSSPARKAKSVGQQPSGLPVPIEVLAAMAGSPSFLEGHDESPEKLSLKARLKLFENEIEQQGSAAPAPKAEKKFY